MVLDLCRYENTLIHCYCLCDFNFLNMRERGNDRNHNCGDSDDGGDYDEIPWHAPRNTAIAFYQKDKELAVQRYTCGKADNECKYAVKCRLTGNHRRNLPHSHAACPQQAYFAGSRNNAGAHSVYDVKDSD